MPAIDLTPAQVSAAVAAPATETRQVVVPAPPLDEVLSITLYRGDANATPPNVLRAIVAWPGRDPIDLPITVAIPVGDRAAFRTALGRILIAAREHIGAT